MRILISTSNTPAFNLATEEFLLKQSEEDCLLLYINQPSVIVGKHQNTLAEVNYSLAQEKNILIHRRLSGGGAVYHDLGNLNFCFIKNGKEGRLVDFEGFTRPVLEFLATLGIDAFFGGHNDLRCGPFKISGNAEHIYRQRVLHHGTLLIHTDLEVLNTVLWAGREYADRAVKSVRATVANLSDITGRPLYANDVMSGLAAYIAKASVHNRIESLNDSETNIVQNLTDEKYLSWEWNFGYSPPFSVVREVFFGSMTVMLTLTIEYGKIVGVASDQPLPGNISPAFLEGTSFTPETLKLCFETAGFSKIIPNLSIQKLVESIL